MPPLHLHFSYWMKSQNTKADHEWINSRITLDLFTEKMWLYRWSMLSQDTEGEAEKYHFKWIVGKSM